MKYFVVGFICFYGNFGIAQDSLNNKVFHPLLLKGSFYQYDVFNYEKAIKCYDSLLSLPKAFDILGDLKDITYCDVGYRIAQCYGALGMYEESVNRLRKSLQCGKLPYLIYMDLSDIFLKNSNLDSGEFYLEKAYKIDSTTEQVNYGLGIVASDKGNYEKTIKYLTKAIEIDPCRKGAWCDSYRIRAKAYYMLGKFELALIDINKHLEFVDLGKTEVMDAAVAKAKILYSLEDFKEAAKYYSYYLSQPRYDEDGLIMNMIGLCNSNLYSMDSLHIYADRAFYWFKKSAEEGYFEGQFNLGRAYLIGEGVDVNSRLSYDWTLKAAQQGDELAQYFLGRLYNDGYDSTWYDHSKAYWFERSAKLGYSKSQYHLGLLYYWGDGVRKDLERAKFWIRLAKNSGLPEAIEAYEEFE